MRKYLLPLAAVIGVGLAIAMVIRGNQVPAARAPVAEPVRAPFTSYVAGAGLIEASGENIAIGTPVTGIVLAVYAKWGDRVGTGDPLFKVDDRALLAELPPARARQDEAEASLAKARHLLEVAERLSGSGVSSREELTNRQYDVAISAAALASAKAQLGQLASEIARCTVRAPAAGRLLQVKIRVGELALSGALGTPLMVLGDDTRLHVRVEIDENDAWRVTPDAPARAFVRGNSGLETALRFERIEPLVIPKAGFTGDSTERTDTRVLQVIYSFDPGTLRAYIGQQVDVYIQAPPVGQRGSGTVRPPTAPPVASPP